MCINTSITTKAMSVTLQGYIAGDIIDQKDSK